MKLKVLVVEDEIIIADNISQFLTEKDYEVTEPALSYDEAIESINRERPDIVLLDIQLSGSKTGIDLAKKLEEVYQLPFIFLTSNSDETTMNIAIDTNPSAFLIKPLNKKQLFAALEIIRRRKNGTHEVYKNHRNIFVNNGKELVNILLDDVLMIKSDNVYVEINLKNSQRVITRSTLSQFIELLNDDFIQTHRSYVVNIKNIDKIGKSGIFIGVHEVPIGNKYRKQFYDSFTSENF